jgi:hypothetical protein
MRGVHFRREVFVVAKRLGQFAAVLSLVFFIGAGPQVAAPGAPRGSAAAPPKSAAPAAVSTEEITEHPEILTMDFSPLTVSLYGVHVGDSTSKVPIPKMDRMTGTLPGIMKLLDQYQLRYNPKTLIVTALVVNNRQALVKAGLLDRYDVEFKFGKPDIADDRHVIYLSRRLLVTFNNAEISTIEVR